MKQGRADTYTAELERAHRELGGPLFRFLEQQHRKGLILSFCRASLALGLKRTPFWGPGPLDSMDDIRDRIWEHWIIWGFDPSCWCPVRPECPLHHQPLNLQARMARELPKSEPYVQFLESLNTPDSRKARR